MSNGKKIKLVDQGEGNFHRAVYYVKKFDFVGCFDMKIDPVTGEPLQVQWSF